MEGFAAEPFPASRGNWHTNQGGLAPPFGVGRDFKGHLVPAARVRVCLWYGLWAPHQPQHQDSPSIATPQLLWLLNSPHPLQRPLHTQLPVQALAPSQIQKEPRKGGRTGGGRGTIFFFQFDLIKTSFKEIDFSSQISCKFHGTADGRVGKRPSQSLITAPSP